MSFEAVPQTPPTISTSAAPILNASNEALRPQFVHPKFSGPPPEPVELEELALLETEELDDADELLLDATVLDEDEVEAPPVPVVVDDVLEELVAPPVPPEPPPEPVEDELVVAPPTPLEVVLDVVVDVVLEVVDVVVPPPAPPAPPEPAPEDVVVVLAPPWPPEPLPPAPPVLVVVLPPPPLDEVVVAAPPPPSDPDAVDEPALDVEVFDALPAPEDELEDEVDELGSAPPHATGRRSMSRAQKALLVGAALRAFMTYLILQLTSFESARRDHLNRGQFGRNRSAPTTSMKA